MAIINKQKRLIYIFFKNSFSPLLNSFPWCIVFETSEVDILLLSLISSIIEVINMKIISFQVKALVVTYKSLSNNFSQSYVFFPLFIYLMNISSP